MLFAGVLTCEYICCNAIICKVWCTYFVALSSRANAQQPKLFVGMILILIFAEALALYGLIVGIILSSRAGQSRADWRSHQYASNLGDSAWNSIDDTVGFQQRCNKWRCLLKLLSSLLGFWKSSLGYSSVFYYIHILSSILKTEQLMLAVSLFKKIYFTFAFRHNLSEVLCM